MTDLTLAQTILTPNEYAAWKLRTFGLSERRIADGLHISRAAVRARLERAERKLTTAKEHAA